MSSPHERLRELGYALPGAPAAMASYVPTRRVPIGEDRSLLYVAGQVAIRDGELMTGRVPDQVSIEGAQEAARACALNILAQLESAGGLDRVEQIAQLIGFVHCTEGFSEHPTVINGASDLLVEVLGDAGRHSRVALGANSLPRGVTVEIAAVAVIRG